MSDTRDLRRLRSQERRLAKQLLERGWSCRPLKSGHLRFDHPGGVHCVIVSGSPSDHRGWKNLRSEIRRAERSEQR